MLSNLPSQSTAFTQIKSSIANDSECGSPPYKAARTSSSPDVSSSRKGKGRAIEQPEQPRRLYVHNLLGTEVPRTAALVESVDPILKYILPSGPAKQPSISYGEALSTVSFLAPDTVQAEELLKKTENALMSCVASITHTLLDPILLSKEPAQWLIHYIQKWQWYVQRTDLLCAVMVGLDRGYVQAHRSTSLGQIGKEKWKAGPLSKGLVMIQLRKSIKQWIDEERETGVPVNRDLIKLLISSLLAVGSYTTLFETTVEDITTSFYRQEAKSWHSKSPVDFLEHAEKRVLQEEERCQQVFPLPSSHVVVSAAEQELWGTQSQAAWISSEAVPDLLKAALKHDANASDGTASPDPSPLVRLHKLFARTGTLENLYAALRDHLDAITSDLVKTAVAKPAKQRKDGDVEQDIISDLMNLKGLLEDVARFLSDKQINQVVDAVYTRSFAEKSGKVAELMAKHIDKALRAKKPSEDGLRRVLDMYRYTPDKDVFRTYYFRGLSKRLLLARSASDDQEKMVIELLKRDYDPEFEKGEEMFKDLTLSREFTADFHDARGHTGLSVFVLQYSAWPITRRKPGEKTVPLPLNMQTQLSSFTEWYSRKHSRHVLEWYHGLGNVTLIARFKHGEKNIEMSMYQALVLLLFADEDDLDFKHISKSTEIGDNDLRRTLQTLTFAKRKLLIRKPARNDFDIHDTDRFALNNEFRDQRSKFWLPNIAQEDTPEETKTVDANIVADRRYTLDAAIVRTMKARKYLKWDPLIQEVIDKVKVHFHPEVKMIKERIESLVDQEYLRRDDNDPKLFHYVA